MKVNVVKKTPDAVPVLIYSDFIKLDAAMKFCNAAESGADAKLCIQEGQVKVNGEVCTMRGKKLYPGDKFSFRGCSYVICKNEA